MEHGLGGKAFEEEIARKFRQLGWQVSTTPTTGDFGADLIASTDSEKIVVQCKDYGSPAGIAAIQEVHFARTRFAATSAIVVARNGFTKAAIKAASSASVGIFRPSEITSGCRFDRTRERQEALRRQEEQDRRRQIEQKAHEQKLLLMSYSELWREYDKDIDNYNQQVRKRNTKKIYLSLASISIGTITGAVSLLLYTETVRANLFVGFLLIVVVWQYLGAVPTYPDKPFPNRRGATVNCTACKRPMRVDFGKDGWIRCPTCNSMTQSST